MPEEKRRALYRVGQLEPSKKMMTELYKCVDAAAAQLNIVHSKVISEAYTYAVALKKALISSNSRLSRDEIAVAALWKNDFLSKSYQRLASSRVKPIGTWI